MYSDQECHISTRTSEMKERREAKKGQSDDQIWKGVRYLHI